MIQSQNIKVWREEKLSDNPFQINQEVNASKMKWGFKEESGRFGGEKSTHYLLSQSNLVL